MHASQDEGWKLNRALYYQEGWLAAANLRGIVGVTFTASHSRDDDQREEGQNEWFKRPARTNYNLRGHRSEVSLAVLPFSSLFISYPKSITIN